MRKMVVLLSLLSLNAIAFAADQAVVNHDGNCVVSVPAGWTLDGTLGLANSPDKKVSVVVSSPRHGNPTMESIAQMAPMMYPDDKITKQSGSEFEMEGKAGNGKPNVYRAVPAAGGKICIAEVQYQSGTAADARAIAQTLKGK